MSRSSLTLNCLFVLWVFTSGVSIAQQAARLKVQPDRLQKAKEAEQEAIRKKDSVGLAQAYYLYGRTYVFAGDYQASQGYFLKSLQLLEPRGDSFELSRIYVRLSENEGRLGRAADALRYAKLSLAVAQRLRSPKALGLAYGVMAGIYENKWNGQVRNGSAVYDSILYYYHKRAAIYRSLNDTLGVAEANLQLGTLFTKAKDVRAIPYLEKSLHLMELIHRENLKPNVLMHLASAYLVFGKHQLGFQTLQKAGQLYNQNKLDEYDTALSLENEYVLYYQTTGHWREAFEHLKKMNALEKGEWLSDREATIARLNVEYETQKKEALLNAQKSELALRDENLRTQQRFTMATSALLVMTAGMSLVFFRLNRKNQRISRQNQELVKEQNHRVKNNLQVVSSLLSLQSKRLTDEAAKKAVEESRLRVQSMAILHQRLYDGDRLAQVHLEEFIQELVEGVLKAYGFPSVDTRLEIDDITLPADKAVPLGLILNELTTNACKYAFPTTQHPSYLIGCRQEKHTIHLNVTDNGPGLEGPGLEGPGLEGPGLESSGRTDARLEGKGQSSDRWDVIRKDSFGMQLIRAQVIQLHGTYQFASNKGTVFTLTFTV
ncbi:sensor histidine kinase [Spirosoma soli]|uniref:histidine kinase n=1 Tax=Spirosoma soli TaxID=1770529 RepID=A0ABW5MA91_9BACT